MPVVIVSSTQLKELRLGFISDSRRACIVSNSDSDAVH